jgi:hypothetical protein
MLVLLYIEYMCSNFSLYFSFSFLLVPMHTQKTVCFFSSIISALKRKKNSMKKLEKKINCPQKKHMSLTAKTKLFLQRFR